MHYSLYNTLILALATILAILISHWILERANKRNEKLMILKELMAYRKNDTEESHKALEQALNLIDVVFSNEELVLEKYHALRDFYLDPFDLNSLVDKLYVSLLKAIASSLKYEIKNIDLDKCVGYENLKNLAELYLKKK
jgi:hypothetical protein